jgi:hypothetical protein
VIDFDNLRPPSGPARLNRERDDAHDHSIFLHPDALGDGAAPLMAGRQFAISLVVAFALLAVAGLKVMEASREIRAGASARPTIMDAQAPRQAIAAPAGEVIAD